MKLIGMLDSPYVRRTAISLETLGVKFIHEAVSVFSTFEKFKAINPVVKAPTLVCDDGEVLMDSSLILQFVESKHTKSLWPGDPVQRQHEFRAVSLALAACEKSVQIIYERNLRPKEAQYEPWMERVTGQLLAAYAGLEQEVERRVVAFSNTHTHTQASITAAVAWQFTQSMLAAVVPAAKHPVLAELSGRAEKTSEFCKYAPDGPGV